MLVVIVPAEVSARDETRQKNKQKVMIPKSLSCAAHKSPLKKKDKERIHLVQLPNVEEVFRSRNQTKTSRNS